MAERGTARSGADRIELKGLRVVGTHGALPEERDRAQPFEVDLLLVADLSAAAASDRLAETVDYGALCAAVERVLQGPHVELLEHLAARIVGEVLAVAAPLTTEVTVTVRKLRPPVPLDLASAAVTITRAAPPS
ncbi:MAG: dihydroneopterin aldolase [Acidimicrobiales bacterium]